jgi:hypothetical protein
MHRDDFTYYYYQGGQIVEASALCDVPEDIEDYCKISDAVSFVQKIGCAGRSQHNVKTEYHRLCLDVLKIAVQKHGEVFPVLLRGTRSTRPDADHQILFGTTDKTVAEFYGQVREYRNIKGLRTRSMAVSVATDDYGQCDEEVIFFAN